MSEELITRREAREILGVSLPTLAKMVQRNNLAIIQFPKNIQRVFYRRSDIEALTSPTVKAA